MLTIATAAANKGNLDGVFGCGKGLCKIDHNDVHPLTETRQAVRDFPSSSNSKPSSKPNVEGEELGNEDEEYEVVDEDEL